MTTIKFLVETPEKTEFIIKSDILSIPNTLRRTIESDLPCYAINLDTIIIRENTSIFHNERLSLVLTMIPVKNLDESLDYDNVVFSLNGVFDEKKAVSGGSYEKKVVITSDDIISSDNKTYFMPNVPIIELKKDEKLIIEKFSLKLGVAKENTTFQACRTKYAVESVDDFINNQPDDISVKMSLTPCSVVDGKCYPYSTNKILDIAISRVIYRIKMVLENLPNISFNTIENTEFSTIIIENQDHTLGYLLQTIILKMPEFKDKFCGYRFVHPLKNLLEIKLMSDNPAKVLTTALNLGIELFEKMRKTA